MRDSPGAPEQVEACRAELTQGRWTHPKRYGPMLPAAPEAKPAP